MLHLTDLYMHLLKRFVILIFLLAAALFCDHVIHDYMNPDKKLNFVENTLDKDVIDGRRVIFRHDSLRKSQFG
jgi:hypothetical protein